MDNVELRLATLPPKVGVPLRNLLAAGQLDEPTLETVLDAGDLARERNKLLGFTAGLVFLTARGVPVSDVINMAKQQGRRINLGWSPNRWQEEHKRLSYAETLARLSAQNTHYDVSAFTAHLPEPFPGYVIRSSRRLGMEGLRQRHCVASYHDEVAAGECAIVVVFLDGKRWTVQLVQTRDADAPLRVVQIKTRFNGVASPDVWKRVQTLLRIAPPPTSERTEPVEQHGPSYLELLRVVLPVLRLHQVQRVIIRFDGSGDSGSVDGAQFEPDIDADAIRLVAQQVSHAFVDGHWQPVVEEQEVALAAALESVADAYLQAAGVDWYNDDGGYGDLLIDVAAGTASLEVNVRYTESTTEFAETLNIETGEEV